MICTHALTEFCTCLRRRPPEFTAPHVELLPGRVVWRCSCKRPDGRPLLRNHQHKDPWECLLPGDVLEFWSAHPEIKTESNARRLLWLHENFSSARSEAF
jgi:hypothetical protein